MSNTQRNRHTHADTPSLASHSPSFSYFDPLLLPAKILLVVDNFGDIGTVANGGETDDRRPVISGKGEPNE